MSSGVYFYRLVADEWTSQKKVVFSAERSGRSATSRTPTISSASKGTEKHAILGLFRRSQIDEPTLGRQLEEIARETEYLQGAVAGIEAEMGRSMEGGKEAKATVVYRFSAPASPVLMGASRGVYPIRRTSAPEPSDVASTARTSGPTAA